MHRTHYDVLGIPQKASPEAIRNAYRGRAKEIHPDVNRSPEAEGRFKELQASYTVLRDPVRRAEYDLSLSEPTSGPSSGEASESGPNLACMRCGRTDSTIRATVLLYTISLLFATWRRADAGIFCQRCRGLGGLKWNTLTAAMGWWGIPWGPIYSLQSLFTNLVGGRQANELNAPLLATLAYQLALGGRFGESINAAHESLRLQEDAEVRSLLAQIECAAREAQTSGHFGEDVRDGRGWLFRAAPAAPMVVLIGLLVAFGPSATRNGAAPNSSSSDPLHLYDSRSRVGDNAETAALRSDLEAFKAEEIALSAAGDELKAKQDRINELERRYGRAMPDDAYSEYSSLIDEFNASLPDFNARVAAYDERRESLKHRLEALGDKTK